MGHSQLVLANDPWPTPNDTCHSIVMNGKRYSCPWKIYIILHIDSFFIGKHDDVIKWKHCPRNWPFVRGIHRSPVNSPNKGQSRGALMFVFYLRLNKRLSKQSWGWWFETLSRPLWRHRNVWLKKLYLVIISKLFNVVMSWCHSGEITIRFRCASFISTTNIRTVLIIEISLSYGCNANLAHIHRFDMPINSSWHFLLFE